MNANWGLRSAFAMTLPRRAISRAVTPCRCCKSRRYDACVVRAPCIEPALPCALFSRIGRESLNDLSPSDQQENNHVLSDPLARISYNDDGYTSVVLEQRTRPWYSMYLCTVTLASLEIIYLQTSFVPTIPAQIFAFFADTNGPARLYINDCKMERKYLR